MSLPLTPGNRFVVGLNEAMFHEEYDHDFGRNQFSMLRIFRSTVPDPLLPDPQPDDPYISSNSNALDSFFQGSQTPQGNIAVVRVWAFERFEALKFDQDGFVTGIDEEHFFPNLERLFEVANNHGMRVYLCLNSWSIHDSPEKLGLDSVRKPHYLALQRTWKRNMRLLLKDPSALDRFITNAVMPLLDRVGKHPALFAIDVMNEPDNILDNERDDTSVTGAEKVTENDVKRYIKSCSTAIHGFDSSIKVSCGFVRYATAKAYSAELAQYLDFFDYHEYNNEGRLEPYKPSDFGNKPCIIGEFGPYIRGHERYEQGKEVSAVQNFMVNAQKAGYAGCLVWMSKDYNNWSGMLQSLQNFADEKRPILGAPTPPPPPPPPREGH